ncbi:Thiamin-phosphate pyrophosphorylase, partial [hydrothermal vent metagenome]
VIAALAEGGAKIIQLREKNVTDGELYELATLYRKVTARHSMLLIINDRADIALAVGADGVHVGSGDMPVAAVRRVMGDDAIIGASSHNVETAIMAEKCGATYVNIGPLYPTPTKPSAVAIGLAPVKAALLKVSAPVSVMGGIVMDNIDDVLAVGVRHIGVVTALFGEKDIAGATRRLVTKIEGARVV